MPQIGAPAAWQAGYTGTGVDVAVLDTGIDATHPDLAGRVVGQRNFTEDPDSRDVVGHGTHVASTIAGSGTASNGRYKGVATGAKLLDGKVCESFGCAESAILAGMEWGAQNARVVNMSLGGPDTAGVDPLEQAVSTLTARYGTLFVISAGNDGPAVSTVSSPGSAAAALTVGAVDSSDGLADFSSRGLTAGDAAIKPDITAPGVGITAARSTAGEFGMPGESYTELSGTSMATPHVAGSAAILAQQHPTWTAAQLKAALIGSAEPNAGLAVFEQGGGRIDLARAVTQAVVADPAGLSFGRQAWPHDDDAPIRRTIRYHNFGGSDLTLRLALKMTGPGGSPTPAGMFRLSSSTLKVPAGGDASVDVTADTSVSAPDGFSGGYLSATAGALTVRTPIAVDKEVESYDLTLSHTDRAGRVTGNYVTSLWNYQDSLLEPYDPDGTVTVRLPRGRYLLTSKVLGGDIENGERSLLLQPAVNVTRDQIIRMDARRAKRVSVTVPRPAARSALLDAGFVAGETGFFGSGITQFGGGGSLHTAQLGNQQRVAGLASWVSSAWADMSSDGSFAGSRVAYTLFWSERGRLFTGFRRKVAQSDLATVGEDFAKHAQLGSGERVTAAMPDAGAFAWSASLPFQLPFRRTEYVNTEQGVAWQSVFTEGVPVPGVPYPYPVSRQSTPLVTYQAGRAYSQRWNRAVFGPVFPAPTHEQEQVTRSGDTIFVGVPLYGDRAGHAGYSDVTSGKTTLFRNGKKIAETTDVLSRFDVPQARARYRLLVQADRGAPFSLSTRTSTAWTFPSGHVGGRTPAALPLSVVRFAPALDLANAAPAGRSFALPVTVQPQPGSAAAANRRLTVEVSYDDGRTWTPAVLAKGDDGTWTAHLQHPNRAGFISLRARATDKASNTVEQTIIRAYRIAPVG